jgi:hypothetical protein
MSNFSISFNDVNEQFAQTNEFNFMYPPLNTNIKVSFHDCNSDVERFVKVIKLVRLYNKKMIRIVNPTNNNIVKTTHNNSDYYKNILNLQSLTNTNITNLN